MLIDGILFEENSLYWFSINTSEPALFLLYVK